MRLAAKISPVRGAERRGATVRATLRETPDAPRDIDIIDISETGFLAELPGDVTIEPGTSVRVAAHAIGSQIAVAVRNEGRRHGFVFLRPLARAALDRIEAGAAGTVVTGAFPAFAGPPIADGRPSARSSLLILGGVSLGLWALLATLLYATARFA